MIGACTIVSPNYLPFARTLAQSYLRHHPGHVFFVLIVADVHEKDFFHDEPFKTVLMDELPLLNIKCLAMKYDILELNTNVKPSFMKYLLVQFELKAVVYLDPDIYVYDSLDPILEMLQSFSVVLTPHLTSPLPDDGCSPCERDLLYNGTYNLGFIAIRASDESVRMLDWWESRCLREAFSEGRSGLFVDQKWINLVPGLFEGIGICRDLGCNMAYWNLSERRLSSSGNRYLVNGTAPLRFFHFSGIDVDDDSAILSKNTDRFSLENRPDLVPLFSNFRAEIIRNCVEAKDSIPYGFDAFSDGSAVTRLQRRIFAVHESEFGDADPFDAGSRFYDFLRRHRLLAGKLRAARPSWREFNPDDRRVRVINRLLLISLRLLGPTRYELLMRYLSFISILRNQAAFIRD
jgi:hypothetical protein